MVCIGWGGGGVWQVLQRARLVLLTKEMGGGEGFKGQCLAAALVNGRVYCECGQGKNHLAITPKGLVGLEGLSIFILSCWEPWNTVFIL